MQIIHGFKCIKPECSIHFENAPKATIVEMSIDAVLSMTRRLAMLAFIGAMIFAGSWAATANPEAFIRGVIIGLVSSHRY